MLKNVDGDMRTYVHPECRELITNFPDVTWKQGTLTFELDKVSDKARTHLSDVFGFMVCRLDSIDAFKRHPAE